MNEYEHPVLKEQDPDSVAYLVAVAKIGHAFECHQHILLLHEQHLLVGYITEL